MTVAFNASPASAERIYLTCSGHDRFGTNTWELVIDTETLLADAQGKIWKILQLDQEWVVFGEATTGYTVRVSRITGRYSGTLEQVGTCVKVKQKAF